MTAAMRWNFPPGGLHLAAAAMLLLCGCQAIRPAVSPQSSVYSLDGARGGATPAQSVLSAEAAAPTLIVAAPHAAAGFDSQRIMYLRRADQLEYFAHSAWVDTPARMLAPLIAAAVGSSGAFRAVVNTPSPAAGEMRLDTEILRLQHEFLGAPSQVRFTLRAYLVESATRRVIETREFEALVPSASEDPHGGVVAASSAVQAVLGDLSLFCAEAARNRR